MIALSQVTELMVPWLGTDLTAAMMPAAEDAARCLNAYTIRREISDLFRELDSLMFRAVHYYTQGAMLVSLPDGGRVRMRLDDIATLADELLFLALADLPVDKKHLQAVQQYSLEKDSLAALKALYLHFPALQTQQEIEAIAGLIRRCYPAFRWRLWLNT